MKQVLFRSLSWVFYFNVAVALVQGGSGYVPISVGYLAAVGALLIAAVVASRCRKRHASWITSVVSAAAGLVFGMILSPMHEMILLFDLRLLFFTLLTLAIYAPVLLSRITQATKE